MPRNSKRGFSALGRAADLGHVEAEAVWSVRVEGLLRLRALEPWGSVCTIPKTVSGLGWLQAFQGFPAATMNTRAAQVHECFCSVKSHL